MLTHSTSNVSFVIYDVSQSFLSPELTYNEGTGGISHVTRVYLHRPSSWVMVTHLNIAMFTVLATYQKSLRM